MDVHVSTLLSDATLDVLGVGLGANAADVLVSVQGDGVIQFDAVKEVRARTRLPPPPRADAQRGARARTCTSTC